MRYKAYRIRKGDEHCTIDGRITLICANIRLNSLAIIQPIPGRDIHKWRVCNVELGDPEDVLWSSSQGGGDIAVIEPYCFTGIVPLKIDRTTWVGKGNRTVLGDGWAAVKAGHVVTDAGIRGWDIGARCCGSETSRLVQSGSTCVATGAVWLVEHAQGREVLPSQPLAIGWAR